MHLSSNSVPNPGSGHQSFWKVQVRAKHDFSFRIYNGQAVAAPSQQRIHHHFRTCNSNNPKHPQTW